jgi:phenylacetate-coenzyme A ligase PaaK-like adenylate-forming protein
MYNELMYAKALEQVMHDAKRSRRELDSLVHQRLRKVLVNAYQHVPYHREVMQSVGYDPRRDYRGPEDLSRLPITTKQVVKQRGTARFAKEGSDLSDCFRDATSGSTGVPFSVYHGPYEHALRYAKLLRVFFINGYSIRDKVMSLSSLTKHSQSSGIQRLGILRREAVDFRLPAEKMVDRFVEYQPDILYGARSLLDLMALELRQREIQPKSLKLVVGHSEVDRPSSRELCEKVFHTKLIEVYGAVEMGIMAYETRAHDGLHLCEDLTYFEFLDETGAPVPAGQPGRVVVTDLMGDVMPFIRYDLGDLAIHECKDDENYSGSQRITRIMGRDTDVALLPDGTRRSFHVFSDIMHDYNGIVQFRVVQKARALFQILVVAEPLYLLSIRDEIMQQLQAAFPPSVRFEIVPVDRINPDPSGKIRMLISEVEDDN